LQAETGISHLDAPVDQTRVKASIGRGISSPLGAVVYPTGVNFSVFSRSASHMELLFFDKEDDASPSRIILMDPLLHHTYHYWHVFVPGVSPGQIYGYRVFGQWDPLCGLRFDAEKVLLDPYGQAVVVPREYSRDAAGREGSNASTAMKSVVVDPSTYDWEGDECLKTPCSRSIIYEMHIKGFTQHPSSGVAKHLRGTFAGLIPKIPYLHDLGVTAVELLPVFQFDSHDCPPGLVNYWGYAPVGFFAPHQAYSSRKDPLGPVNEFRDMVKALHRAGIEVILDVVYNHTAEGGHSGPTLSFRGFDNPTYYLLEQDRSRYVNFSGCGNTVRTYHPIVRRMILDSLRYWVTEMHVDGFRFDLASILSRDNSGRPIADAPLLWDIESDPQLAGTKLIAEAWDAAGLYQVGNFIGDSWMEWNGHFRDDLRSFVRGERDTIWRIANRIAGSPDLYAHKEREAEQSVNYVTCHDGFTLNDLVSYNTKHNAANGEENRDGTNDNRSWNCGIEGPADNPDVQKLRNRQIKNLLTVTALSLGTPLILMGDEMRRTQNGNNNNYCHDDETNWLDWGLLEKHRNIHRFVRLLLARRRMRDIVSGAEPKSLVELLQVARRTFHGVTPFQPDWAAWSHSLAVGIFLEKEQLLIHWMMNAYWQPLQFDLPLVKGRRTSIWHRWIDTFLEPPADIVDWQSSPVVTGTTYRVEPRSVVVLFSRHNG
jgi:glycogen operon protein